MKTKTFHVKQDKPETIGDYLSIVLLGVMFVGLTCGGLRFFINLL